MANYLTRLVLRDPAKAMSSFQATLTINGHATALTLFADGKPGSTAYSICRALPSGILMLDMRLIRIYPDADSVWILTTSDAAPVITLKGAAGYDFAKELPMPSVVPDDYAGPFITGSAAKPPATVFMSFTTRDLTAAAVGMLAGVVIAK